jgi:hypothetical protein
MKVDVLIAQSIRMARRAYAALLRHTTVGAQSSRRTADRGVRNADHA